MAEKKSNDSIGKVLLVVPVLCLVRSIVVAGSAVGLKSHQQTQRALDKQCNTLAVAGLIQPGVDADTVVETFTARISPRLVNLATGELLEKDPAKFNRAQALKDSQQSIALGASQDPADIKRRSNLTEIYLVRDAQQQIEQMVLPTYGNSLWSMVYAFVALDVDGRAVKGITYYDQGETPGLDGEVGNPNWCQQFIGKQVLDDNGMPVLRVVEGGARAGDLHAVDGLSGVVLAFSGVQHSFDFWMDELGFGPFLKKVRKGGLSND